MISRLSRLFFDLLETLIRNIGGGVGARIRYVYYSLRFGKCGRNVKIGVGVNIYGPKFIQVGDNVWIDDYCVLIAGDTGAMNDREVRNKTNKNFNGKPGYIYVGSNIHFAPYCIIHGYGGVEIKDYVGFSSGVKLYSMSNHYKSFKDGSLVTYNNPMVTDLPVVFIKCPIVIEENVFVSLNSIVLAGTIGRDTFISPQSVIISSIPKNSIASGNPCKKVGERFDNYVSQ